jgi:Tfp pilus assembly protein PilV
MGRGVILLEVLLALTLFVVAATVIGGAMLNSVRASAHLRTESDGVNLAQSKLAELVAGAAPVVDTGVTDFGDDLPGWKYQIEATDLIDTPGLKRVTVTVSKDDPADPYQFSLTQWVFDQSGTPADAGSAASAPDTGSGT